MPGMQSGKFDLNENALALLLGELDHRIRNLLMMIEAAVRQTHSTSVEDYRAKLITRIGGLHAFYKFAGQGGQRVGVADLLEQIMRPYCANGGQVQAVGPDLELERPLALALHLVFHELATNANKYGALSSPLGRVKIEWKIRHVPGAARKLAIVWTEHGGPQVQRPRRRGFGSRLIKRALDGYGGVRWYFNGAGLVCFLLIHLDRADIRTQGQAGEPQGYGSRLHAHSSRQ
jgi:two-component sensor histidine kinase